MNHARTEPLALDVFACPLQGTRLIEASAGTGKTWNICGLFMRLLLESELEVQQILVVTFTNAATAELRERIRSRVKQTLDRLRGSVAAPTDPFVDRLLASLCIEQGRDAARLQALLVQALHCFDEAAIFTIHGFCQRALGDAPFTAGVPLRLELLADDSEMREQVVCDFWRRRVAGGGLPANLSASLASHLTDHKDSPASWGHLLRRQLAKPLSQVLWPDWPSQAQPGSPAASTPALEAELTGLHRSARDLWRSDREAIALTLYEARPRLNGNVYKDSSIATAIASWDELLASDDALRAPGGLDKLDLLSADRLKPKKNQAPVQPQPFFALAARLLTLRQALQQGLALARLRLLHDLLQEAPAALRRAKQQRRVVAFDDMLFNLHQRLNCGDSPDLAEALRERFPAALIDEFQDTDPLQFAVFKQLYGDSGLPLFLVGDPKQAIYSFRGADLNTYLQAADAADERYTLTENQRSTPGLLRALNALFGANPQAFMLVQLPYLPVACGAKPRPVLVDRSAAAASAAPLQLWALPPGPAGGLPSKDQARAASAQACAAEIARLLGAAQRGEILIDGRALAGGDIAVLVRSHSQGSEMRLALAALGVGSVEHSRANVLHSRDADELERVLAAVLEPRREPKLRAALATELMGLDAAALDTLAGDETALLAHVERFSAYRRLWLQRGVGRMLRELAQNEGLYTRWLQRPDGERRLTNQRHLAELLHQAESALASPEALLRWLQAQRSADRSDDATQLRLESDRLLVQIVTVHRAKGLEYAMVFCPFLWAAGSAGSGGPGDSLEYHDASGQAVIDFRPLPEDERKRVVEQAKLARSAEDMRLIYVALTRAVHRCWLVVGAYGRRSGQGGLSANEGGRGLLPWLAAGKDHAVADWLGAKTPDIDAQARAWERLAAGSGASIALAPLPSAPGLALLPAQVAPESLQALPAPTLPPGWTLGSYSSLSQGAKHEAAAREHDMQLRQPQGADHAPVAATQTAAAPAAIAIAITIAADDILRFPRGAAAGECLHAVFENVDFTAPLTWPAGIAAALSAHPQPGPQGALPAMAQRMLEQVLGTPLPWGIQLDRIAASQRLVELEFNLPAATLSSAGLERSVRELGYPCRLAGRDARHRYLRGFIDLVFEHQGRYYIVDWKSNHLGETPAHYGAAAVQRAMDEQGYHLQVLLYSLALHRYLGHRLPDYAHGQHFGGVLYLFVRGLRPGWKDADGHATGVYSDRPSLHALETLSLLFQGEGQPA